MENLVVRLDSAQESLNVVFLLILSILIFLMQAGFAFLEAGSVRAKNTSNILVKNIVDSALGSIVYWAIGYGFGFGSDRNGFIGTNKFFLINVENGDYADYFHNFVFAVTSATIVSGAIAERAHIMAYLAFTIVMTGFIYPVVTHWVWTNNGWLANLNYVDFAGSSVVHCVGGTAALVGSTIVGARMGRFERNGTVIPIPGHSTVLVTLGFFILWFGFFAFNGSSERGIIGQFSPDVVARCLINTALSCSGGVLSALLILKLGLQRFEFNLFGRELKGITIFGGFWSITGAINGGIAGMVSICAGCNIVEPWAGLVIGIIAGAIYCLGSRLLLFFRIDDPLQASAIHLGGGIWGVLAAVLFANSNRLASIPDGGILYSWSGDAFILLGIQVIGVTVIICWSALFCIILFGSLRLFGMLRVSEIEEEEGLDFKGGEPAYPLDPGLLFFKSKEDSLLSSENSFMMET